MNTVTEKSKLHRLWLCLTVLCVCMGLFAMPNVSALAGNGVDLKNWMKELPDTMQISQINMAGTHDTGCYYIWSSVGRKCAQTQDWTFKEQLEHGLRVFDIRLGHPHTSRPYDPYEYYMRLCHGSYDCFQTSEHDERLRLANLLDDCSFFLSEHPSETIVMVLREEKEGVYTNDMIHKICEENYHKAPKADRPYPFVAYYKQGEAVPKLGDVRGKVIWITKKTPNGEGGYDNNRSYTDYATEYEWYDTDDYADKTWPSRKREDIERLLALASSVNQEYYSLDDHFVDLKKCLNHFTKDKKRLPADPIEEVKSPMFISTNLTQLHPSIDIFSSYGPRKCWEHLYYENSKEEYEDYANFKAVSLNSHNGRTGWWQFDFPQDHQIQDIIESNYLDVIDYELRIKAGKDAVDVPNAVNVVVKLDNGYELQPLDDWTYIESDDSYVLHYGRFPAENPIADVTVTPKDTGKGNFNSAKLIERVQKKEGAYTTKVTEWYELCDARQPHEAEVWVVWEDRTDVDVRPDNVRDFLALIGGSLKFRALDENKQEHVFDVFELITSTDNPYIGKYIDTRETSTSLLMVRNLPAYLKNGGLLTYTNLTVSGTTGDYTVVSIIKEPRMDRYTIRMKYKVPDGMQEVPVRVEWLDGGNKYGTREPALNEIKKLEYGPDRYKAWLESGNQYLKWQLQDVQSMDDGDTMVFVVKDLSDRGYIVRHEIKAPDLNTYHYRAAQGPTVYYESRLTHKTHQLQTFNRIYLLGSCDIKLIWADSDPSARPDTFSVYLPGEGSAYMGGPGNVWTASNVSYQVFDVNNHEWSLEYQPEQKISISSVEGYTPFITAKKAPMAYGQPPHYDIQIVMRKDETETIEGKIAWHHGGLNKISHDTPVIRVIRQNMVNPAMGWEDGNIRETEIVSSKLNLVWTDTGYRFDNAFPKFDEEGSPCRYRIEVDPMQDYDIQVDGWDMIFTRLITLFGKVDWEDPTHRPMSIQPVVSAIQNDCLISASQVTAEKYGYAIKNLPISDENDQLYEYEIFTQLPGLESDERIIYTYEETKQVPYNGNVQADATICMRMPRVTAMVPVKLTLKNTDAATEPDDFIFMLEGETRDGVYRDYMLLYNENEFTDEFELNLDLFEDNRSYSFKVWQNVGPKPCWDYDKHVEELTLTIRYINGVRVPQLDMGGKSVLEFTNARVNDTEYITAMGSWIDGGLGTMYRPERTAIHLLADGVVVRDKELTAENDYRFTFTNLPIYRDTQDRTAIEYTLEADAPEGYQVTVLGDAATGFKVTYTRQITVSGTVDWENGKRPANNQPMIQLLRNGQMVGDPIAETDFAYKFEEQPIADRNNDVYEYSIVASLDGFDVAVSYLPVERSITGDVIANAIIRKHDSSLDVEIPVQLTLKDDNPATEPESFFFLMEGENKEGTYQGILTLDSDTAFTGKFVLDGSLFENNKSYTYTIKQINGDSPVWDYDIHTATVFITMRTINGKRVAQVDMGGDTAVRFINTRLNNTEEIMVTARWNNGTRKTSPTHTAIRLYGDGVQVRRAVLTQAGSWTCTFAGLPLYRESLPRAAVEYTVDYDVPEGYTAVLSGDSTTGFVITYTATVSVSGSVDWVDDKRPANNQPSVQLLRNDQMVGQPVEEQNFKYAFENLPIADESNVPYHYSIVATLDGFDTIISYQPIICDADGNVTANALISKIDIPVQAEIPVKLILSGVDASSVMESFCFIIERADVNSPFRTLVELNRENNYTDFFVLDASGYESGKPYSFTVRQLKGDKHYWIYDEHIADISIMIVYINGKPIARVDTDEKGLTFRNVYCAVPGSISIELDKQVVNLLEGIAVPDQQTFRFELLKPQLTGNMTRVSTASVTGEGHVQFPPITLTDTGTYTYVVREYSEDVPGWIFDHTGYPVKVTVSDVNGQLQATADVIPTVTNTYETTMLNVGVKVNWVDNNKKKKPIPDHIRINLFADEKSVGQAYSTAENNWMTGFADVPEYRRSGTTRAIQMIPIVYTLTAETVDGFTVNITGEAKSGYVVTYTSIQDVPKTGDRMNLPLTSGLLLLSASLLFILVHKRQQN